MKLGRLILNCLVFYFLLNIAFTQQLDPAMLTVDRIYNSEDFSSEYLGKIIWSEDGNSYLNAENYPSIENGQEIIRHNINSGKNEVFILADKLTPAGMKDPLILDDFEFSKDEKRMLIYTNSKKVWRRNTRGDYWVLNLKNWKLEKLGGQAESSSLMFATFSPDGKKVAFVINNNLYVEDLSSHEITALTVDGSETLINGTSDWVYEEELGLRNGFRWSPDSKKIAFWQLNADSVGIFYMINNIDSLYSQPIPIQYPKVGTINSACRIGVIDAHGGQPVWIKVPGDPRNHYIAQMEWAVNSDEIILQQLNRLQNTNKVFLCSAESGIARTVFIDTDNAWVDVNKNVRWLNQGKKFMWISERDGWRHVYMVSRDGQKVRLITPGEFDVISIESIDEKNGWIYFIAAPNNPAHRYLFRTNLYGDSTPVRISPTGLSGTHSYDISLNSKWAFHTFSKIDTPPIVTLINLPEHKSIRTIVDNSQLQTQLNSLKRIPTEFFRINIGDDILLDGYLIKPYNFEPTKQYPVLFYVYGEPWVQTVRDRWGGKQHLWHLMLAQQGYIIVNIDNRGTPAPRGRAWRKSIYKQVGIMAAEDQAAACRIIRDWEFVDSTRIGIWGWSGGGSMSLNAIFRYPDLYHTAMAISFISDQRMYDTIYQERYMALPDMNPDGYKNGSPITHAHKLDGNLLIIYGTGDDNCHYQNAELLMNELIKHNKMFTAVPYPMRSHSISERENTTRHLRSTLTWYLNNHLSPGPLDE